MENIPPTDPPKRFQKQIRRGFTPTPPTSNILNVLNYFYYNLYLLYLIQ